MSEKTLNDPLSGFEIKEIILQEIGKRLDGDTTLENDIAYAGFTAKFDIGITFLRSLTKPTQVWGAVAHINPTSVEEINATEYKGLQIQDSYTSNPSPDVERQSHDLLIPVMMSTPTGMERKRVRLGRPPGSVNKPK